jgi:hypothetical protein
VIPFKYEQGCELPVVVLSATFVPGFAGLTGNLGRATIPVDGIPGRTLRAWFYLHAANIQASCMHFLACLVH